MGEKVISKYKKWLYISAAVCAVFIAFFIVFISIYSKEYADAYGSSMPFYSAFSALNENFGLVIIAAFVLAIGLVAKKKASKNFVLSLFLAIFALCVYYIIMKSDFVFKTLFFSTALDIIQQLNVLCSFLPPLFIALFTIIFAVQINKENNKATYNFTWFSFLLSMVMLAVRLILIVQSRGAITSPMEVLYFTVSLLSMLFMMVFSMFAHVAGQNRSELIG